MLYITFRVFMALHSLNVEAIIAQPVLSTTGIESIQVDSGNTWVVILSMWVLVRVFLFFVYFQIDDCVTAVISSPPPPTTLKTCWCLSASNPPAV